MRTQWKAGLSKDEAKEIELQFNASGVLRKRLDVILDRMSASAESAGRSKEAYDSPNWALKKADETGYLRALAEIKNLLR